MLLEVVGSTVLTTVGLTSLYLTGHDKRKAGLVLGIIDQFAWTAYATLTGQWAFILSAVAYAWVYNKNLREETKCRADRKPKLATRR